MSKCKFSGTGNQTCPKFTASRSMNNAAELAIVGWSWQKDPSPYYHHHNITQTKEPKLNCTEEEARKEKATKFLEISPELCNTVASHRMHCIHYIYTWS